MNTNHIYSNMGMKKNKKLTFIYNFSNLVILEKSVMDNTHLIKYRKKKIYACFRF
jgi:hypothetical protein